MSDTQRTLVLLKPDAVQRGLIGEIVSRLERTGLKIIGMKLMQADEALAKRHYGEHEGKPFFDGLVRFITSSPLLAMVLEGPRAIEIVRKIMGQTDPAASPPGTVRGDFSLEIGMNLVHGSDSTESAAREVATFFKPDELVSWKKDVDRWIVE